MTEQNYYVFKHYVLFEYLFGKANHISIMIFNVSLISIWEKCLIALNAYL